MHVAWLPRAARDLKQIERGDPDAVGRIIQAVEYFAAEGHGDVKRLAGEANLLRLRVGDWRIIFSLTAAANTVTVIAVRRRDQAYR